MTKRHATRNKAEIKAFYGRKRQKLEAVKFLGYPANSSDQIWKFICDCGGTITKNKYNFLKSKHNNCGCTHGNVVHGLSAVSRDGPNKVKRPRAYHSWVNMRQRCNNPNNPDYPAYGGRGIKIYNGWNSFETFLNDMGPPGEGMTLDRIDNSGDYTPENCRWASRFTQSNNRDFNRIVTFRGKTQPIGVWAAELPINATHKILYKRLFTRGWTVERAFTQPVAQMSRKS